MAYFSWSGNTRKIAGYIHELAGGDIFEITTVNGYSTDYNTCLEEAKAEQDADARPKLASHVANMADYDVIFLGYPNWWGTCPMAILSFLEEYDFSGKTIIPFCTHGGGGFGRSLTDIKTILPHGTTLGEGFQCNGSRAGSAKSDVEKWLRDLGFMGEDAS